MIEQTLATWHRILESGKLDELDELLAEDVVFWSPVVHSPQKGKVLTKMYLHAASAVFAGGDFTYRREVASGNDAVLEFETEIDGIYINGVDMIRVNDAGKIVEFKVMVRPLKAINLLFGMMAKQLQEMTAGEPVAVPSN